MNREEDFERLLAEKLTAAHSPEADQELWLKIEARIQHRRPRSKHGWQWFAMAASVMAISFLTYVNLTAPETSKTANASAQLYILDIELQQALLNTSSPDEIDLLLKKRKQLQSHDDRSYQL